MTGAALSFVEQIAVTDHLYGNTMVVVGLWACIFLVITYFLYGLVELKIDVNK